MGGRKKKEKDVSLILSDFLYQKNTKAAHTMVVLTILERSGEKRRKLIGHLMAETIKQPKYRYHYRLSSHFLFCTYFGRLDRNLYRTSSYMN